MKETIFGMPPGLWPILVDGDLDRDSSESLNGDFAMLMLATELSLRYMLSSVSL